MSVNKATGSPFLKQCLITAAVSVNNLAHGSGLGYPAVLLPQLRHATSRMRLDAEAESWVASITAVALLAGNLLTIPTMRRGRKMAHQIVSLLHIAGWIAISLAPNYEVLMIGRFLQGASNGLLLPIIGVIIGEYTSPAHRGIFLSAVSLSHGCGVLFVHLVGSFLAWEDTALLLAFFPLASFAITVFTPESPSWLAMEGRYEECRKAFRWMRGYEEEEELEKMIQARQHFDRTKTSSGSIFETIRAFSKRELYIPLVLGSLMYIILICSGSCHYSSYMDEILRVMVDPDGTMPAWMAMCNGVRLVTNVIAMYVVGRLPRRTILFTTGILCTLAYFAQAAYITARTARWMENLWLPAILLIWHMSTIGLGLVSLAYVIVGEIFPLQFRGICSCASNLSCSMFLFVLLKTFPAMCGSMGLGGVYVVYGIIMAMALAVCWFLLPETRGRTLQEIEEHFRGKPLVTDDLEAREALNDAEKYKV